MIDLLQSKYLIVNSFADVFVTIRGTVNPVQNSHPGDWAKVATLQILLWLNIFNDTHIHIHVCTFSQLRLHQVELFQILTKSTDICKVILNSISIVCVMMFIGI